MENDDITEIPLPQDVSEEELFETTPEQATAFGSGASSLKPETLNRKKLMIVLSCSLAFVVCGGLIYNAAKPEKKKSSTEENEFASNSSSQEFLSGLRDRAVFRREKDQEPPAVQSQEPSIKEDAPEPALPPVSFNRPQENRNPYPPPSSGNQTPPQAQGGAPQQAPTHYTSSLVPPIQGSLFSQGVAQGAAHGAAQGAFQQAPNGYPPPAQAAARNPSGQPYYGQINDYAAQNNQENKQSFLDSSSGGAVFNGQFLGNNSVWTGTIIPGILETAVNTDLPGNVLARVTQNIYDSQSGRNLLIPQGTLLLARYNSSISYAQRRIQIVWDTMIRPDGFQINLEGAGGVDKSGMSGQPAEFHENWFEYVKAAGIITLFSYANAKMTEAAAKYASEDSTANIAASNANFVGELGGKLIGRATNIQPTLTVDNGTLINIMLNKTLFLPPVAAFPASQKYSLE